MNPLNLSGPSFLLIYLVGWMGLSVVAFVLRKIAQSSDSAPTRAEVANLHPYEMAYLLRGPEGAIESSVAALVAARYLVASPDGLQSVPLDPRSLAYFHPLDQAILRQCLALRTPRGLGLVLKGPLDEIRKSLEAKGLIVADPVSKRQRSLVLVCGIALILFGAVKALVGVSRDRPVGFLIVLVILGAIVLHFLRRPWPRWTTKGEQAKRDLWVNYAGLNQASRPISVVESSMAAGIFGLGALGLAVGGGILPSLFFRAPTARRGGAAASNSGRDSGSCSSCGSSSCSSSSCSSSSCGGGGGCGGCGSS